MKVFLFEEISLNDDSVVKSVYDTPSTTVNHKIYEHTDNIAVLSVNIIKTFPFKVTGKSIHGLYKSLEDQIKIYELQKRIDEGSELEQFYEAMHAQNFSDPFDNPWKYTNAISIDKIIIEAYKLGIVSKGEILEYLLHESDDGWSYELYEHVVQKLIE
jgi:hypothetical protein